MNLTKSYNGDFSKVKLGSIYQNASDLVDYIPYPGVDESQYQISRKYNKDNNCIELGHKGAGWKEVDKFFDILEFETIFFDETDRMKGSYLSARNVSNAAVKALTIASSYHLEAWVIYAGDPSKIVKGEIDPGFFEAIQVWSNNGKFFKTLYRWT